VGEHVSQTNKRSVWFSVTIEKKITDLSTLTGYFGAEQSLISLGSLGDFTDTRRWMMKKMIFSGFVLAVALLAPNIIAVAQTETAAGVDVETDIALLRRNLRADKKKLIALNVPLTETEATKFWPVYDQYAAEMAKHNDEFYLLIKEYAAKQKTITDAEAISLIKRWADLQVEATKTRQKYIPIVEKVIPGRKAALFFQIDRRLYALMDLQTSMALPLLTQ
jgi:hypothetical protein